MRQNDNKSSAGRTVAGSRLTLKSHEPWPDPINGAELVDQLCDTFTRYLMLPAGAPEAMALWVIHAHAFDAAEIAPRLAFESPEKRCGKTTALKILERLVPRPLPSSNITPAVLFRAIDLIRQTYGSSPTILIDEGDTFLCGNNELRGILNSGHEPENAFVMRCVGDNYEPRLFNTWAPVAIAMIGRMSGTLEDRSIVIRMKRCRHNDPIQRFTREEAAMLEPIARKVARWVRDNLETLKEANPGIPKVLDNRAADNWRPLLSIADLLGGDWWNRARDTAIRLSVGEGRQDVSVAVVLLDDIRSIFEDAATDKMPSEELRTQLNLMEHRPWSEYQNGGISVRQIARLLEPFGIRPTTIRLGEHTPKGYKREDFSDTFSRYLPDQCATTPHANEQNGSGNSSNRNQYATALNEEMIPRLDQRQRGGDRSDVWRLEQSSKSHHEKECGGVSAVTSETI